MNFTRNQIIIVSLAVLVVLIFILIFLGVLPGWKKDYKKSGQEEITISFWGVEDQGAIRELTDSYSVINPNVRISYQQFDESNYERSLVNALAGGQGPDIFMIHNSWLPKHWDKINPFSDANLPLADFRQMFPTVAEQDFVANGAIYALPLYIDTLAFIYNKNFFDAKGVAIAPKTWNDFQYLVPRLGEISQDKKIIRAAAAIGGSQKSVNNAGDLLSLIMMQFGAAMFDENSQQANFARSGGQEAFDFYLQFANPGSRYYAWNDNLRYSLDSFAQETVGAIFNYYSIIRLIKEKNPFINLAVSEMLQLVDAKQPVNYADYWGLSVSKFSKNPEISRHFIQTIIQNEEIAEKYMQTAKRPPALRFLIQKYLNDSDFGVFSRQALTARSWRRPDNAAIRNIFSKMIEAALSGRISSAAAMDEAENKINGL